MIYIILTVRSDTLFSLLFLSTALGTIGLYIYFHHSKVSEVASQNSFPRHKDTKASSRGSDSRVATGDTPADKSTKGSYYTESGSAPGGLSKMLYPHLDTSEREHLDNLTVPHNEGTFGRSIKHAAALDQLKKNRDADRHYKRQGDLVQGHEQRENGDRPLRSAQHLQDLHGQKRNY